MKLLDQTVRSYILVSALLIMLSTPLFYFSIRHLFEAEMDKVLQSHKEDFLHSVAHLKSVEELEYFPLMNKEFIVLPAEKEGVRDSIYTQDLYDSAQGEYVPHRVYRTGIQLKGYHYELYIRESLLSSRMLIAAIMGIQILVLLLLLLGLTIINRQLSRIIWEPFYSILDVLKRYNLGAVNTVTLPSPRTNEFKELSEVIGHLIRKNEETYLLQKEFTENAAHELQTPIAIWRTKLELLVQTKELTEEQAELAGSLLETTDRITRLNKNLLLLTKIDSRTYVETEEIDLAPLVEKALHIFDAKRTERKLELNKSIDRSVVRNNTSLFDILINNLISNAYRHTMPGGRVSVTLDSEALQICNSGEPLQQPDKIFDRFHRQSRNTSGTGLGLSIVKKICSLTGFTIDYQYTDGYHCFRISFRGSGNPTN
jgi:signal transduction histidine kinase